MKKLANLLTENGQLKLRLDEAKDLLAAIKDGSIDAYVAESEKIFTLKSADLAYRVLVETMNEGAATLRHDGMLMYCNRRLAGMLGRRLKNIIGASLFDFVGVDEHQRLESVLSQSRKKNIRTEFRFIQENGMLLPVLLSCNSLKPDDSSLCLIITDLTDLKSAELELEVKNRQLKQLADRLFQVEAEERKRLADLLHDGLQQILVACVMRLSTPHYSRKDRDDIHKLLVRAIDASRTLSAELRPPILFEKGLVAGILWFIERNIKQLGLTIDVQKDGYKEITDKNINLMLYQCVRELIFNIIKHAQVTSAVVIFSTINGQSKIQVNDFGCGFAVPAAKGKNTQENCGIGFFSIGERLQAIGGKYSIESHPGKGTSVTLTIPYQKTESFLTSDGTHTETLSSQKANINVLVVDDHKLVREGIVNALSAEKDISVIGQAENGMEAVSKANELNPDIVVMDLNMPVLNGSEAARMLRQKKSKAKIIIISVNADKQSEQTVLESGADAFLSKASDLHELLRVIRTFAS